MARGNGERRRVTKMEGRRQGNNTRVPSKNTVAGARQGKKGSFPRDPNRSAGTSARSKF